MEEAVVTWWSKILFEYGFLWVSVAWLSFVVWKIINAVRKLVLDLIERQRTVIKTRDDTIIEKDKIILELSTRIAELEGKKKK